jgi:hypothetical protein
MGAFANQYTAPTAEFGADPADRRAGGLLRELWSRVQGARTHPYGPEKGDPSTTWNGYAQPPQAFHGLQQPLGGSGTPYRPGGFATIDTGLVEGPLGDPARRIFAQRLARRTPGGM